MPRKSGMSVRLKLTLSYAGFLMLAGTLMLAVVWVFLLRYVPDGVLITRGPGVSGTIPFSWTSSLPPRPSRWRSCCSSVSWEGGCLPAACSAPLTRITDATRLAANGSLSHRIAFTGRNDEFRELADAFDTMLARLEAHDAEQRRFAANASHELRTPLAITQTLLDVARNDPNPTMASSSNGSTPSISARSTSPKPCSCSAAPTNGHSHRERVDLSLIAEEAAETLLPLAEKRGITVETAGRDDPDLGSHALLLQLTTNLVHNALVHNLPERGTVWSPPAFSPGRSRSRSKTPERASLHSSSRRSPNRSSVAPSAYGMAMRVSASAWRS